MPAQQNVAKKLRKSNKTWRFGSNTKTSWTQLFKGEKVINSPSTAWNENLSFKDFDVIMMVLNTQQWIHTFLIFTDGQDRKYSEAWGYYNSDGNNRLWTLSFTTAGRYFSEVKAMMKLGDQPWQDTTGSVYVMGIYGAHWLNS